MDDEKRITGADAREMYGPDSPLSDTVRRLEQHEAKRAAAARSGGVQEQDPEWIQKYSGPVSKRVLRVIHAEANPIIVNSAQEGKTASSQVDTPDFSDPNWLKNGVAAIRRRIGFKNV